MRDEDGGPGGGARSARVYLRGRESSAAKRSISALLIFLLGKRWMEVRIGPEERRALSTDGVGGLTKGSGSATGIGEGTGGTPKLSVRGRTAGISERAALTPRETPMPSAEGRMASGGARAETAVLAGEGATAGWGTINGRGSGFRRFLEGADDLLSARSRWYSRDDNDSTMR